MSYSIPHSHFVEMSWRTLHFCKLFLDLPTPTISLLRDLQVGQSNSCLACSSSTVSSSSLLFSLEIEIFHLSLCISTGCLFRGFVVFRKLFLDLSLKIDLFCLFNGCRISVSALVLFQSTETSRWMFSGAIPASWQILRIGLFLSQPVTKGRIDTEWYLFVLCGQNYSTQD